MNGPSAHWNEIFTNKTEREMSWFREEPTTSLDLLTKWTTNPVPLVDVGAGTSRLVDQLLSRGWSDVTLLDVSSAALESVRQRLGGLATKVTFINADVNDWTPTGHYGVWHDRAVFHFLVDEAAREHYVASARDAVRRGGVAIVATFAADGPTQCSGLPVVRYDSSDLVEVFGPSFLLEETRREEHVTPFAVVQPFTWVVLRRR